MARLRVSARARPDTLLRHHVLARANAQSGHTQVSAFAPCSHPARIPSVHGRFRVGVGSVSRRSERRWPRTRGHDRQRLANLVRGPGRRAAERAREPHRGRPRRAGGVGRYVVPAGPWLAQPSRCAPRDDGAVATVTTQAKRRPRRDRGPVPPLTGRQLAWLRHRERVERAIDSYLATDPPRAMREVIRALEQAMAAGDRASELLPAPGDGAGHLARRERRARGFSPRRWRSSRTRTSRPGPAGSHAGPSRGDRPRLGHARV